MDARQKKMVKLATEKYGQIVAIRGKSLEESFTEESGMLIFWFNDVKGSTHIITDK